MGKPLKTPSRPIQMRSPAILGSPHPLPATYKPLEASTEHQVRDGETWHSLAIRFHVPADAIIRFNFQTLVSDHVNWYLHAITGCNKTTDDINWAFSDSARPGIVYIPPQRIDYESEVIEVKRSRRTEISRWFDPPKDPSNMLDLFGKVMDIVGAVDTALSIFAPEVMPIAISLGIVALGAAGPTLAVASPHLDAINYHIKEARLSGFSQGIVVGSFGKAWEFSKWNFIDKHRNFNSAYPHQRRNLEFEYKRAFVAGYLTGKDFTNWERGKFVAHLNAQMRPHPKVTYGEDRTKWPIGYFIDSAAVFRRLHLR